MLADVYCHLACHALSLHTLPLEGTVVDVHMRVNRAAPLFRPRPSMRHVQGLSSGPADAEGDWNDAENGANGIKVNHLHVHINEVRCDWMGYHIIPYPDSNPHNQICRSTHPRKIHSQ